MNDKSMRCYEFPQLWNGLRNKSSRNHRRVMKKLNKAA